MVYDVSACAELVCSGCGEKAEPHSVKMLAEKVLKIKKEGKGVYSQNCIDRVKELFDYETNMRALRDIYNGAIDDKR